MSDLMPKEFYDAFRKHFGFGQLTASASADAYQMLKAAEWAWNASRECLVIDLPAEPECPEDPEEAIDDSHMDAYHSAIRMRNACRDSIHAAGVKVK